MTSKAPSTLATAAAASPTDNSRHTARPNKGCRERAASGDAMAAPHASPVMKTATMVLKVYVVGPRIIARRRVHTTWSVREAKPESPSATAATHRSPSPELDPDLERFVVVAERRAAEASAVSPRPAISQATPAEQRFKATPTNMVSRNPNEGRSTNPARTAPSAAPMVLTVYSRPTLTAARVAPGIIHREAMGKVAPMAAAGSASKNRLEATRNKVNVTPGLPSAYAITSRGWRAASSRGTRSARIAIAASRPA